MPVGALLLILLASLDSFVDDLGAGYLEMISGPAAGFGASATGMALLLEPAGDISGFLGDGPADAAGDACDMLFGYASIGVSSAVWAAGGIAGDDGLELTGMRCTEALALCYGISGLLKVTTRRERPDGSDRMSFPSFHSASSAAFAAVAWSEHGPGAGVPLAALAAFTALSRIHRGDHHISDAVAGLAIGAAAGIAAAGSGGGDGGGVRIGIILTGDGLAPVLR